MQLPGPRQANLPATGPDTTGLPAVGQPAAGRQATTWATSSERFRKGAAAW
eukprot:COSAG01_NODE_24277_length_784_cov_1.433577_1_plen_50_part_10